MSNEAGPDPAPSERSSEKDQPQVGTDFRRGPAEPAPEERSLWNGGFSGKAMYGTWAGAAGITVIGLVLLIMFARGENAGNVWLIAGAAILLMWVFVIGLYLYRRYSYHYELTTQRLIHQNGIFVRRSDRIEVIDIDDVSYSQGIVQRMLGVGRIVVTSSDRTHPELILDGIDKVDEIAGLMDDVRREERRRRSLHIERI